MTNFEKFGEELNTTSFGVVNGKPNKCYNISCADCEFYAISCSCNPKKMEWLKSEYTESKITIPEGTKIDTKILVSFDGKTWGKRYYAGKIDGVHSAWSVGRTSWTATPEQRNTWEYMKLYNDSEQ